MLFNPPVWTLEPAVLALPSAVLAPATRIPELEAEGEEETPVALEFRLPEYMTGPGPMGMGLFAIALVVELFSQSFSCWR